MGLGLCICKRGVRLVGLLFLGLRAFLCRSLYLFFQFLVASRSRGTLYALFLVCTVNCCLRNIQSNGIYKVISVPAPKITLAFTRSTFLHFSAKKLSRPKKEGDILLPSCWFMRRQVITR